MFWKMVHITKVEDIWILKSFPFLLQSISQSKFHNALDIIDFERQKPSQISKNGSKEAENKIINEKFKFVLNDNSIT